MNRFPRLLPFVLLGLLTSLGVAQTQPKPNQGTGQPAVKKSPLIPYAGNWIGTFDGKPWMLLNLNLVGEQFSGLIDRAREFEFADNGELKKVGEDFVRYQLSDAKLTPDGLLLTFDDTDKHTTQRYIMKLTGDTTAEIKMIAMSMPPGMPKPKPWKLTKEQ